MNRLSTMIYECLCDYTVDDDMNLIFNGRSLALASIYHRIQTAIRTPNKTPVDFFDSNAEFRLYGLLEKMTEVKE